MSWNELLAKNPSIPSYSFTKRGNVAKYFSEICIHGRVKSTRCDKSYSTLFCYLHVPAQFVLLHALHKIFYSFYWPMKAK